jgi:SAM-dependent methyltransferase
MTSNETCFDCDNGQDLDSSDWIQTACLNCESNADTAVKYRRSFSLKNLSHQTFSARRETEHYHYRILQCRKCGLVFSSPVLAPGKLAELYRGSKLTYAKEASEIAGTYMRYLRCHEHLLTRKGAALEIGCGNGFFLRELSRFGFEHVMGVEPSEDAVARAGELQSKVYCGFFEDASFDRNSLDLICCFQTLDHVINPLEVLRKSWELLRPGGIAYLIVHNERALQARMFGEKSPIYDVEHVYLFNPSTISRICQKAGFRPERVFGVCNTYPLEYWLRMAPIPGKRFCLRTSEILQISRWPVTIPAGNLGIFARKPC